jgi:hypothetical protein
MIFSFTTASSMVNGSVSDDSDLNMSDTASYWEELPCGLYSIHLKDLRKHDKEDCIVEVRKHEWVNSSLNTLIQWERKRVVPTVENSSVDKGNHQLSQNLVKAVEAEDIDIGVMKRDLHSDISLCAANCITESGITEV